MNGNKIKSKTELLERFDALEENMKAFIQRMVVKNQSSAEKRKLQEDLD